jgi:hypothetical protein
MKTIRQGVFETNSSSCHVLTVADQNEYDLIKNGQAVIYVPHYSSDDSAVYDSVILTKDKYLELVKSKFSEFETKREFFEKAWDLVFTRCDIEEQLDNLAKDYDMSVRTNNDLFDIIWHCIHEEDALDTLDCGIKKEVNGSAVYISCWSKYC